MNLGTADPFAILAGAGITNTGSTTVTGDVGSHPTPAQTGFGPGADSVTLTGTNHHDDAVTQGAKDDLVDAYDDAAGRPGATPVAGGELGSLTLTPGVYADDDAPDSLAITGTLTLDGLDDADSVFIFQSGSTLVTASGSNVELINGAQACNIFWQVTSSATLGTGSHLEGTILALTSITLGNSATVNGRILARNGAVTLDTNTVQLVPCAEAPPEDATLTIRKDATPDSSLPFDFQASWGPTFSLIDDGASSNSTAFSLAPGTYSVDEIDVPDGWVLTGSSCDDGSTSDAIVLSAGEDVECTFENGASVEPTPPPPGPDALLTITKVVINDNGGTATVASFVLKVGTTTVTSGAQNTFAAGTYTVSETGPRRYAPSFSGDCTTSGQVTLATGDVKECTITNDDLRRGGGGGSSPPPTPPPATTPPATTPPPTTTPPPAIPFFPSATAWAVAALAGLGGAFFIMRKRRT